jgi:transposase
METPGCQGCSERDQVIANLQQQVADLQARLRELEARLGVNASNSSLPPSANPPGAPKPVQKKPTGRQRGAQPKHPPLQRTRLPRERIQHVIPLLPTTCEACGHGLSAQPGPADPEPSWHQVAELPRVRAVVTEFQGHYRTCPCCGRLNHHPIPQEIKADAFGPRFSAALGYLRGTQQVSTRGLEDTAEVLFDVPVSLGSVAALGQELSLALAPAHSQAAQVARQAEAKNVDETSWKLGGKLCWLWTAVTSTVSFFVVHSGRGLAGLQALLGETILGLISSDRWSAYNALPPEQRQICWAHLKRDFQKCVDRGGPAAAIGQTGLAIVEAVFERWHRFRGGGCSRDELIVSLVPLVGALRELLQLGQGCADAKVARFCANVAQLELAVWQFVTEEGVEPTNNAAERALRRGVLWRKRSFGSQSEGGCRLVERLLTVVGTRRLQRKPVLAYLEEAVRAHRAGLPCPSLI